MSAKKLFIIRHAKAETPTWGKSDFDRELVGKGKIRANQIAKQVKLEIPQVNDQTLVLSSTALRAAQTAEIFCKAIQYPSKKILWTPSIYEAEYTTILRAINGIKGHYDTVLIFGHNPGLSDLVFHISDQYINLKTSHTAYLELEAGIGFHELSSSLAELKKVLVNLDD